jgi:hypothetical protein
MSERVASDRSRPKGAAESVGHEPLDRTPSRPSETDLGRSIIQAKLSVGPATDRFEVEADAVADRVVRSISAGTSPVTSAVGSSAPSSVSKVQRSSQVGLAGGAVDSDTESKIRSSGSGRPMHEPVRRQMESAFGADFSGVRIHEGPRSAELNNRIQAKAFTVGSDIHFRDGAPDTSTSSGQHLLAHELTHTIQQSPAAHRSSAISSAPAGAQRRNDFARAAVEARMLTLKDYEGAPDGMSAILDSISAAVNDLDRDKEDKVYAGLITSYVAMGRSVIRQVERMSPDGKIGTKTKSFIEKSPAVNIRFKKLVKAIRAPDTPFSMLIEAKAFLAPSRFISKVADHRARTKIRAAQDAQAPEGNQMLEGMIEDDARDDRVLQVFDAKFDELSASGVVKDKHRHKIRKVYMKRPFLEGDRADGSAKMYYGDDPGLVGDEIIALHAALEADEPGSGPGVRQRSGSIGNDFSWDD